MSTLLFHGPAAREAALLRAEEIGRLLAPPFGDDGLKTDTSREIVEMLSSTPVGDEIGVVVVGPLDEVHPSAADALLKTLEEFDGRYVQPILWAQDAGSVIGTIRSRSLETWCPSSGAGLESAYMKVAESLCRASLERRRATVIETLKENEGHEDLIIRASCRVLVDKQGEWPDRARMTLWGSLREVLAVRNPTRLEVLSAYLV